MKIEDFTLWASTYIKERNWTIPVTVYEEFVRVGVDWPGVKSYDNYSIQEILDADTGPRIEMLKVTVKLNLERLRVRLESLSQAEKMKQDIRKKLGG
ncbi:MAG: hypothetical protein WC554_19475 [Clostridia bacterium]|jgi:hypothetical protein